jgi:hypothetical protein
MDTWLVCGLLFFSSSKTWDALAAVAVEKQLADHANRKLTGWFVIFGQHDPALNRHHRLDGSMVTQVVPKSAASCGAARQSQQLICTEKPEAYFLEMGMELHAIRCNQYFFSPD